MKTVSACIFAVAFAATGQAFAAEPAYSTRFSTAVETQRNCYMSQPQFTSTPYGEGFLIRAKNQHGAVLLVRETNGGRAELYRASDKDGHRLMQAIRQCELTLSRPAPVMRNPQRLQP